MRLIDLSHKLANGMLGLSVRAEVARSNNLRRVLDLSSGSGKRTQLAVGSNYNQEKEVSILPNKRSARILNPKDNRKCQTFTRDAEPRRGRKGSKQ
jgi:hypothetical protein